LLSILVSEALDAPHSLTHRAVATAGIGDGLTDDPADVTLLWPLLAVADPSAALVARWPFLSADEAAQLVQVAALLLLVAASAGATRRAQLAVLAVRRSIAAGPPDAGSASTILATFHLLTHSVVHHSIRGSANGTATLTVDPRLLLFEVEADILLRPGQVDFFRSMCSDATGGQVRQLLMGEGKTTVLTPLLSVSLASRKRLVVVAVPSPLVHVTREALATALGGAFGRSVVTLSFTRAVALGVDAERDVAALRRRIEGARRSGSPVVSTSTAIKSLLLAYVELRGQLSKGIPVDHAEADPRREVRARAVAADLGAILELWQDAVLLLDEVDVLLDPLRSQLNFPVGGSMPVVLAEGRARVALHLVHALDDAIATASEADTLEDGEVATDLVTAVRDALVSRALVARPHPLLVDRRAYARLRRPLAQSLEPWLREEFARDGATLERLALGKATASGDFDKDHRATAALIPDKSYWASPIGVDEAWWRVELRAPTIVRAVQLYFVGVSNVVGKSGLVMTPASVHVEVSPDGGETWLLVAACPAIQAVRLATAAAPPATSVRISLRTSSISRWTGLVSCQVYAGSSDAAPVDDETMATVVQHVAGEEVPGAAYERLEQLPTPAKRIIAVARNAVVTFLPHALSKQHRVHYGLLLPEHQGRLGSAALASTRSLQAVPFSGKDVPSPSAEFASPDVTIALTVLAYRRHGLRRSDVALLVAKLKDEMVTQRGALATRPAWRRFHRWVQGAGVHVLPLQLTSVADEEQAVTLHRALAHCVEAQEWYLSSVVFPRILETHAGRISASGEELGGDTLFDRVRGFSGTPSALLPQSLGRCYFDPGSEGRMLLTLSSRAVVRVARLRGAWTGTGLCSWLFAAASAGANEDEGCSVGATAPCALIDVGALLVEHDNASIAHALLTGGAQDAGYDGIVYFDGQDRAMVLLARGGGTVPLEECGLSPSQRFTFYDQVRSTGAHVDQPPDGTAVVLLGKDMGFRDYAQACWRMRRVGRGQTVVALLVDEIVTLVRASMPPADLLSDVDGGGTGGRRRLSVGAPLAAIRRYVAGRRSHGDGRDQRDDPLYDPAVVVGWLVQADLAGRKVQAHRLAELQADTIGRRTALRQVQRIAIDCNAAEEVDRLAAAVQVYVAPMRSDEEMLTTRNVKATALGEDGALDLEIEHEKEQEVDAVYNDVSPPRLYWGASPEADRHWSLKDALSVAGTDDAATGLHALCRYKVAEGRDPLPVPPSLLLSVNQTPPSVAPASMRFKSVYVLMQWTPSSTATSDNNKPLVAALSLSEASSVRWMLANTPKALPGSVTLWDATYERVLAHTGDPHSWSDVHPAFWRWFNYTGQVADFDAKTLVDASAAYGPSTASAWNEALVYLQGHRRRDDVLDSVDWATLPFIQSMHSATSDWAATVKPT
jgi:hypothetical protein